MGPVLLVLLVWIVGGSIVWWLGSELIKSLIDDAVRNRALSSSPPPMGTGARKNFASTALGRLVQMIVFGLVVWACWVAIREHIRKKK